MLHQEGYIEANPFMNHITTGYGVMTFLIVNLILSILIIYFLSWGSINKLEGKDKYIPLAIYCIMRGIVVVNNMLILMS